MNVLKHLIFTIGTLPFLNIMMLTMDLIEVCDHLLVFSHVHCLFGEFLLLPLFPSDFVLILELASDLSHALFALIIAIHDSYQALRVIFVESRARRVPITLLFGLDVRGQLPLVAPHEQIDLLVLLAHLLQVLCSVLALDKGGHHAGAGV